MAKNGLILLTPTSISYTGTGATINPNGSVSFTSVGEVILNGVFSADYRNYRVVYNGRTTASNYDSLDVRVASGGTKNTSNYYYQIIYGDSSGRAATKASNVGRIYMGLLNLNAHGGGHFDVYDPYVNRTTVMNGVSANNWNNRGYIWDNSSYHYDTSLFDGISLGTSQGTGRPMTGMVAVYGMRD